MLQDFKKFALRGNVVDLAVGLIVGSAFTSIVRSLVDDVLMPPLGLVIGGVDFSRLYILLRAGEPAGPYASLEAAREAGAVTLNYGMFINSIVTFILVALATFLLVRALSKLQRKEEAQPAAPATKECPFCRTAIPVLATRCPACTSQLTPVTASGGDGEVAVTLTGDD